MTNLSDYVLKQMEESWQNKLREPATRTLLERTLEDLNVVRDSLNQKSASHKECHFGKVAMP